MITDSGNRTEFTSGAVRDIQEGKGRCDLFPIDIVNEFLNSYEEEDLLGSPLSYIQRFIEKRNYKDLIDSAISFAEEFFPDPYTAMLEYSIHLEEGAKKYGECNWQKGIPLDRYIDSAVRHYLKHLRGDTDERHDRAFLWNVLCGAWTAKHLE